MVSSVLFLVFVAGCIGKPLDDIFSNSLPFLKSRDEYRAKRVAAGLAPDLVPHSEFVRMRDGTGSIEHRFLFLFFFCFFFRALDHVLGPTHKPNRPASNPSGEIKRFCSHLLFLKTNTDSIALWHFGVAEYGGPLCSVWFCCG